MAGQRIKSESTDLGSVKRDRSHFPGDRFVLRRIRGQEAVESSRPLPIPYARKIRVE